jgi:uncharacterized protein YeaO (DUF488 family)
MAGKRVSAKSRGFLSIKRVYEPPQASDGTRILVDRLWPRGIAKHKAKIDLWLKDIAPSDALRRRVHGDPEAWEAFLVDYGHELTQEPAASAARDLLARAARQPVTLLYAARNVTRNNAVALKAWLEANSTMAKPPGAKPPAAAKPRPARQGRA